MYQHHRLPADQLCAAYLAGQSTIELARRYRCSPTTVAKRLRACGVVMRRSRFVPAVVAEPALRRAYMDERRPIAEIARMFGVSPATIGNKRRHYGIPPRGRAREA